MYIKQTHRLRIMTVCAMLVALNVVLGRFGSISTQYFKISFGFIAVAMAGMYFGPFWGCAVGALGDFIGAILFPFGAYFPGFTLTNALVGLTYGFFLYSRQETGPYKGKQLYVRTIIAIVIIGFVWQLGLNSYWLYLLYNKGLLANLATRVGQTLIMLPIKYCGIMLLAKVPKQSFFRIAKNPTV